MSGVTGNELWAIFKSPVPLGVRLVLDAEAA
jgi:hypothetical protein